MKALVPVRINGRDQMVPTTEFRQLVEDEFIDDRDLRHFRDTPSPLITRVLEQKGFVRARYDDPMKGRRTGWALKSLLPPPVPPQPPPKPPALPKPKAKRPRKPKAKAPEPKKTIAPSSYLPRRILA